MWQSHKLHERYINDSQIVLNAVENNDSKLLSDIVAVCNTYGSSRNYENDFIAYRKALSGCKLDCASILRENTHIFYALEENIDYIEAYEEA
jgi:hypothetical protein